MEHARKRKIKKSIIIQMVNLGLDCGPERSDFKIRKIEKKNSQNF